MRVTDDTSLDALSATPDPAGSERPPHHADALDARRDQVLDDLLPEVAFDGWTAQALGRAARYSGSETDLPRLFPRGALDALDYWSRREDARNLADFAPLNPKPHGITARLRWLVRDHIEGLGFDKEAARRGAATLALPPYAARGARMAWRTADGMWRAVGDTATDFNHYSKRAILSGVYLSTTARWFADDSDDAGGTWAFLDDRLADVGRFERAKGAARRAGFPPDVSGLAGALGRLRYPNRP